MTQPPSHMRLSVIIVSYNTRELLDNCLASLQEEIASPKAEVIVVDNGSSDGSEEMLRQKYPRVRLIINSINKGFAAANNIGIRIATGKYVLLLNPDTRVSQGACENVIRFMNTGERKMIVGCTLLNPDGTVQPSVRSFPSVRNLVSESFLLYRLFPRSPTWGKYYMTTFEYANASKVDWVMGAFMMIDRTVMDRIGELDERFFMYGEEADFCFRASKAGIATWFFPGASVVHLWGGSSQNILERMIWTKGSQLLFFEKHFEGWTRYALYALLIAGIVIRVPAYLMEAIVLLKKESMSKAFSSAIAAIALPYRFMRGTIFPGKGH